MKKKKTFKAFAFMGERGGITLKKRFKILEVKNHNDFKVSFNGGVPIHIDNFKGRWTSFEEFPKEITKAQAKEAICESLTEM